jgi:hypothetical protein
MSGETGTPRKTTEESQGEEGQEEESATHGEVEVERGREAMVIGRRG